jgi:hypothetical protein
MLSPLFAARQRSRTLCTPPATAAAAARPPRAQVKLTQDIGNDAYGMQMHQGEAWETCGFDTHLRVQETTNAAPGSAWW